MLARGYSDSIPSSIDSAALCHTGQIRARLSMPSMPVLVAIPQFSILRQSFTSCPYRAVSGGRVQGAAGYYTPGTCVRTQA